MVSVLLIILLVSWIILQLVPEDWLAKRGFERSLLFLIIRWQKGLDAIDRAARRWQRVFRGLGTLAVVISVPLIIVVFASLFLNAGHILNTPDAPPGVAPILPEGIADIPGVPAVPWKYWVISIVVILVFHEIMHGLVARAEDIPLRSLGIFLLTLVPLGAFVEPDDEELEKKDTMARLRVYAAGSMGNFIAALLAGLMFLGVSLVIFPIAFDTGGLEIRSIAPGSPAALGGLPENDLLISIGGHSVEDIADFGSAIKVLEPDVPVDLETESGVYTVVPIEREGFDQGYIGIAVYPRITTDPLIAGVLGEERAINIYGSALEGFRWIFLLNFLVGLTNLMPIVPLDGGRMFGLVVERISPKKSRSISTFVYLIILGAILINAGPLFNLP